MATRTAELKAEQDKLTAAQADLKMAEEALDEAEEDLTTRNAELKAAQDELKTVKENSSATATELSEAKTQLATAQTNLKNAQDNLATATTELTTVKSQLATANTNLTAAQNQVVTLQGQVVTLNARVTSLRGQVQQGNENLQDQLDEAQQANVNARASAYIDALTPEGSAQPTNRTGVSVTYNRGGTLTINPGGNFQTGSGAPSISGFTARPYTRQVGVEGQETLYLYTNIQAPGGVDFWKIYGLEVGSISGSGDTLAKPGGTPSQDKTTNPTKTTVSGSYAGVSGTFTCTTATYCAGTGVTITPTGLVTRDTNNQRVFTTNGTWTFKPGNITSDVQQTRDNEHLFFGIWVREPSVASEAHAFQYIVGGLSNGNSTRPTLGTNFSDLSGTATFSGGAIGKYVTRNQVGENAKIGTFTASANFTANFDDDNLEGRITNFRDKGQTLPGEWNVYLGAANNVPANFSNGSLTGGVSSARIGGVQATGAWTATLYGSGNVLLSDRAKYPVTRYPVADLAGLTGTFRASSTDNNTALAGTFGATPR